MGLTRNRHVEEVRVAVWERLCEATTAEFDSEFIFVRDDGETHALSIADLAHRVNIETLKIPMMSVYQEVIEMIHSYNRVNDAQVVGLVHSTKIGEEQGDPHLMLVALDNTGYSKMTLFPINFEGVLGDPVEGSGYSPFLDPWAKEAGRAKQA